MYNGAGAAYTSFWHSLASCQQVPHLLNKHHTLSALSAHLFVPFPVRLLALPGTIQLALALGAFREFAVHEMQTFTGRNVFGPGFDVVAVRIGTVFILDARTAGKIRQELAALEG
jgi:hypothetical protein